MPFASFLAGSLITLLIPVGLLIAIAIWYALAINRIPYDPSEHAPHATTPEPNGDEGGAGA